MLSRRVPVRALFDQAIFAHALVCLGTALSLWWAFQFCELWLPKEPLAARAAAALAWEGARLYLTPQAILHAPDAAWGSRWALKLSLLALVVVLTGGSVAASATALDRAEAIERQRIREAAPLYQDALVQKRILDAQLKRALETQAAYDGKGMWSKGGALDPSIAALRAARTRVAAAIAELDADAPVAAAERSVSAREAHLAGPDADAAPAEDPAGAPRTWLRYLIILALKLIAPAVRIAARMQGSCAHSPEARQEQPTSEPATPQPTTRRSKRRAEGHTPGYAEVRASILAGETSCAVRSIQRFAKVGQTRAIQMQGDLLAEGIIARAGQGYVLAPSGVAA